MLLSFVTLAKYGFNQRRLTEVDFYSICESRGITVLEKDVATSFYFFLLGREVIVIDSKLTGVKREFAMWHEASHALLGSTNNGPRALFHGMVDSPEEDEADAFASIALIPKENIEDASFAENCCCGFAAKVYELRCRLFQTYHYALVVFFCLLL